MIIIYIKSKTILLPISDIVLKVRQPLDSEISLFQPNSTLISFIHPGQNSVLLEKLAQRELTVFGKTRNLKSENRYNFSYGIKITIIHS